jgi:hypothetical protein
MKNPIVPFMLVIVMFLVALSSCQKDVQEPVSQHAFAAKYTKLTLEDRFDLPNPNASEQYALQLFDLKEDGDGLTERELLSVGNPAENEDLVYALLFVEAYDRHEILWSWLEPQVEEGDLDERSSYGAWKWTGDDPIASMYCSGFKKWPAYKVKDRFTDPCGDVILAGPVYQCCYKLCDDNLPVGCDVVVNNLRINELQVIGSHNSYRKRTDPYVMGFLEQNASMLPPYFNPDNWDYEHLLLDAQFTDYSIRSIEFDVFDDPAGGLFFFRYGKAVVAGDPAAGISNIPELMEPGLKMLHYPDLDYNTNDYYTFRQGLTAVKDWSDAHPTHLPIVIIVEPKEDNPYVELDPIAQLFGIPNMFTNTIPFTVSNLTTIENEIWSVFGDDQVLTPDEVRGNASSLNKAVTQKRWPKLEDARGKIMFVMLPSNNEKEAYLSIYPELQGATLFLFSDPGNPETAFVRLDDPVSNFAQIQNLVNQGYMVRTRADAETVEARYPGDITRRDKAFTSGAQIVSTDYYRPDPRAIQGPASGWSDYSVFFPNGELFRVNPVNGSNNAMGYIIRE